jgi:hypothetical protein
MNRRKAQTTAVTNGTDSIGIVISFDTPRVSHAAERGIDGNQSSEDAVQVGHTGGEDKREGIGRRIQGANKAKGFAVLESGQSNGLLDQNVGDKAGVQKVEGDQLEDFQTRTLIGRPGDPVDHQATGSATSVASDERPAETIVGHEGDDLVVPGRFIKTRMAQPGQNERLVQFVGLEGRHGMTGHRTI